MCLRRQPLFLLESCLAALPSPFSRVPHRIYFLNNPFEGGRFAVTTWCWVGLLIYPCEQKGVWWGRAFLFSNFSLSFHPCRNVLMLRFVLRRFGELLLLFRLCRLSVRISLRRPRFSRASYFLE